MKKKLGLLFLGITLLVISIASAATYYGSNSDPLYLNNELLYNNPHSNDDNDNYNTNDDRNDDEYHSDGYTSDDERASVRFRYTQGRYGPYDTRVNLIVYGLYPHNNRVYEAWLVDANSGYRLSLGAFNSNDNGRGDLTTQMKMVNPKIYDELVVTEENVDDSNPHPGNEIISINLQNRPGGNDNNDEEVVNMEARMTGNREVPHNDSPAYGNGYFTVDTDTNIMHYDITYHDLEAKETEAHIHGPADPGENAPPLHSLPLGAHKVGNWHYPQSLEDEILDGETYVNVHSKEYPNGEIRGQIVED